MATDYLLDGFSLSVSLAQDVDISWDLISGTPPSITTGEGIDVTTMSNTEWKTKAPNSLKELTNSTLTVAYDPDAIDEVNAIIKTNGLITFTLPDTSTLAFYGWVSSFTLSEFVEGTRPTAEVTLVASNRDATGAETGYTYTTAA